MRIRTAVVPVVVAAGLMLGAGTACADATNVGNASDSPGTGSGNLVQTATNSPLNNCGNSTILPVAEELPVLPLLNFVGGTTCTNN